MKHVNGIHQRHRVLRWIRGLAVLGLVGVLLAPVQGPVSPALADAGSQPGANITVFATGLDNPRGLKFNADGVLYVAEGGRGGTNTTSESQCTQVPPPVGPYSGGMTARISKISSQGERTTVAEGLPSSQTSPALGGAVSGVSDVAFLDGKLYALLAGAGCSHGVPEMPNAVVRVNDDGTWDKVADLSAFLKANPVQNPSPGDFEPDGTWYSMVAYQGNLYAVEPNHGELDRITPDGQVSRVIDISASQGHSVPVSVDGFDGHFYVGNLTTVPVVAGAAKVLKVNPNGEIASEWTGFTNIVGVAFDKDGNLFVLEGTVGHPEYTPDSGDIVRVKPDGTRDTVATGLSFPTALTVGPDGALYVSNKGFGFPPGTGEVVRVELNE